MNENSIKNLKPAKKGEVRNPNGRPKKLVNALKTLPPDAKEKIYDILAYALTLPDEQSAKAYLEMQEGELGKYGIVLQICVKQLVSPNWGFDALMHILDRLYGKPKQQTSIETSGDGVTIVVNSTEQKEKIEDIGNLEI